MPEFSLADVVGAGNFRVSHEPEKVFAITPVQVIHETPYRNVPVMPLSKLKDHSFKLLNHHRASLMIQAFSQGVDFFKPLVNVQAFCPEIPGKPFAILQDVSPAKLQEKASFLCQRAHSTMPINHKHIAKLLFQESQSNLVVVTLSYLVQHSACCDECPCEVVSAVNSPACGVTVFYSCQLDQIFKVSVVVSESACKLLENNNNLTTANFHVVTG